MPFREAHEVVGKVVRACQSKGIGLEELSANDHPALTPEAIKALKPESSLNSRSSEGGTSPKAVRKQLAKANSLLSPSRIQKTVLGMQIESV